MEPRRVVVIGSGPAGAAAAHELLRCGVPVTLLESGVRPPRGVLVRAAGRNLYRRVPEPVSDPSRFERSGDPETRWFEHLQPGGLSNLWTGAVPRFAPDDFTEGERLSPAYRWPVSYADLAPYYTGLERLIDVTADPTDLPELPAGAVAHPRHLHPGWAPVARAAQAHGQHLTVYPLADGPDWMLVRRGTAFNSFERLLAPYRSSPLLEVRDGAHALRLEWSGAARRVRAVEYHDRRTGATRRLEASAVVVACGAVRSAKLLFDSACADFPEGLGNTEGVLGTYLHDHAKEWWTFRIDPAMPRLAPSAYLTRLPYATSAPLRATQWSIGSPSTSEKIRSLVPGSSRFFATQVFATMVPTAEHYARPAAGSTDEFGLSRMQLHICFDDETMRQLDHAREHLLGLLAEAGISAEVDPIPPQTYPGNAVHYGGTVRMHADPRFGMLDGWNRLHDVPGVLVTDSSCFTTSPEKNPTLTAMALSARAARRLAHDLKRA